MNEVLNKFLADEQEAVSSAIDKLLDLEARQDTKTLTDTEFGILENLLIKIRSE